MGSGAAPDRYELVRLLGRGGMGTVYCARDTRLERNVALKVLRHTSADPDGGVFDGSASVMRMLREARAAAALEHPNIVTIYDFGEMPVGQDHEPQGFIAMELIEGRRLRDCIGRSDIDLETRVAWLTDIARALAFAHERGIIHRDIKPENVMVRHDGVVKVLDFGIARSVPGIVPRVGSVALPTLTEQGMVLGTVMYMAPEQMSGAVIDGRADQFSWGVLAYELLAGKAPWPAEADSIQIVAQVCTQAARPLCDAAPAVPAALARIVDRAIAREKGDRFPSMNAVLEALRALPPPSPSPSPALEPTHASPPSSTAAESRMRVSLRGLQGALAVVAVGVAALAGSDSLPRGREVAQAAKTGDDPSPCRSNADCPRKEGNPTVCRSDTGACVTLASEDCHAVAEASDLEDDATVWFGAMFPLVGEEAQNFGTREFQAVDLARSEFAYMLRGMHARPGLEGVRPLGIVACDDSVDAARAARHLVDDVGVPAIIGFRTSKEVIDLATSLFIPRGVLTVAALNTSPIISSLPGAPNQPRMVFRTTYSSAQAAAPIGFLVSDVVEPEMRALPGALRKGEPLRVALVRQDDAAGIGFADALFRKLRFNGRAALENESSYRELTYPFDSGDGKRADFEQVAQRLLSFAPHVVIHFGADEAFLRVIEPLERGWTVPAFRPRYLKPNAFAPSVLDFVAQRPDRRRRFFSITSASTNPVNARFVVRYSEAYTAKVTRAFSPNSSYDAFYLLAYSTYALGREPVTGASLARMIGRLVPPGRSVDVGPNGIFDALKALAAGDNIDLNGATGRLDFDLDTGEALPDLAVLCVKSGGEGTVAESVESGLTYDAAAGVLRGAMHCP